MIRANAVLRRDEWQTGTEAATITLDYDRRHRRRLRFTTSSDEEILLDLPEAAHMRDGDAMRLEDGRLIAVQAAPEELLEVRATDADTLSRLAWHLGNRHLSAQFLPGAIRILADHVIAAMIIGLGGTAETISAPFDPEPGAYHHG